MFYDCAFSFVERSISVFVGQRCQRPVFDQFLGDLFVAPETSVVQRSVAVFVCEIDVGAVFQQL